MNSSVQKSKYFFSKNPHNNGFSPYLVFDESANLHLPLNLYVRFLSERFSPNTTRGYLTVLVAYFSWQISIKTDINFWNSSIEIVRNQITDYLLFNFKCQLKKSSHDNKLIYPTEENVSAISIFLSAIKNFYASVIIEKKYTHENPLTKWSPNDTSFVNTLDSYSDEQSNPNIPIISGVSELKATRKRLTESYFIIVNKQWTPQIIDDDTFPRLILDAGNNAGWDERQNLITRILFETGARVSEVCGLTLGDWYAKGLKNEATTFSKGSRNRRVKFIRWSDTTTKKLLHYFDYLRIKYDSQNLTLKQYLASHSKKETDLYQIPLFLSNRATALSPNTFRDLYWSVACKKASIKADIHQARHWYVTQAIRQIYSLNLTQIERDHRINDLIQYMNWKTGKATLDAYEHFFSKQRHGEIQDSLHLKLDQQLNSSVQTNLSYVAKISNIENIEIIVDEELEFLMRLGGKSDAKE